MATKHPTSGHPASEIQKTKQEALARKLRRSINTVQAILTLAKSKKISVRDAAKRFGKTRNYISCAMFWLRAAENKNGIRLPEVERMAQEIQVIKTGKKASRKKTRGKDRKPRARRGNITSTANILSHITADVEYEFPILTDRKPVVEKKKYPLEAMEPGHAFVVPTKWSSVRGVKRATTMFAKRNPGFEFLQRKEGREFVTYRIK